MCMYKKLKSCKRTFGSIKCNSFFSCIYVDMLNKHMFRNVCIEHFKMVCSFIVILHEVPIK